MKPAEEDIVRRAYELWEKAGKPDGRDQEFYHQAESELKEAPDGPEMPHRKPKLEARHPDTKAAGRDGVWSCGNCDLFRMPLRSLCGKATLF